MKLQSWIVYKKIDGEEEDFGEVKTSVGACNEIAWNKAAHKYLLGKPYTIGWSMHVRKGEVVDVNHSAGIGGETQ